MNNRLFNLFTRSKLSIAVAVTLIVNGGIALFDSVAWLVYRWSESYLLVGLIQPLWMVLNTVPFLTMILFFPQRMLFWTLDLVTPRGEFVGEIEVYCDESMTFSYEPYYEPSMIVPYVMLAFNLVIFGVGIFLLLRTIKYKRTRIVRDNTAVSNDDLGGF